MLREIGTEYQEEYPPSPLSTDSSYYRVTWRVVAHVDCLDEARRPIKAEKIEAIKIEVLDDQKD